MRFEFKRGEEVLESFTLEEMESKEQELRKIYDEQEIKSYEIEFVEGTKVKEVHDLTNYLENNDFKKLIIKLK